MGNAATKAMKTRGWREKTIKSPLRIFWPLAVIAFLWIAFSSPYFFKSLIPFPSRYLVTFFPPWNASYGMPVKNNAMPDVITQLYPWKQLTINTWKKGEIPLWNPYSFSGTPHLANYQSAVLSPLNILFFLLPQVDAWSMLIVLQPLFAGLCMYLFLRSLERSAAAATLASYAFMFCGFIVVWMAYGTLGYAALFLPLILWAITKERNWMVSIGLAMSFLSGHFQISLYVAAVSFFYALIFNRKMIRFLFLGLLLAAPQLLPSFDAYAKSVRSELFSGGGEIIPWKYLVTLVSPDFYGNPVTRNDWFGHYAEWSGFIGVVPFLLALYAMVNRRKSPHEKFFILTALVSVFFALPSPLSTLLFALKIPALSTSAASRVIIVTSFSLALLSSYGLDTLRSDWRVRNMQSTRIISYIAVLFLGSIWGMILFLRPFDTDKLFIAKRNFLLPSGLIIASISVMWIGLKAKNALQMIMVILLVGMAGFDMLRFATKWMPFEEREYLYPKPPVISFLTQHVDNERVFGNFGNELATNFAIPSVEGYDAVYGRRYGEFISALHDGLKGTLSRSVVLIDKAGDKTEKALQLLGVRYLLYRVSDGRNIWAYPFWNYPWYRRVYVDDMYEVIENTQSYPRAFLASSYTVGRNDEEILSAIFNEEVNLRETVVLEEEPEIKPADGGLSAIAIDLYSSTVVRVHAASDVPKILFLSDSYDDGWNVYVNGRRSDVLRANYAFRAVSLPAGDHRVEFRYMPTEFRLGVIISLAAIGYLLFDGLKRSRYANRVL